jgi:hypothetical protein
MFKRFLLTSSSYNALCSASPMDDEQFARVGERLSVISSIVYSSNRKH